MCCTSCLVDTLRDYKSCTSCSGIEVHQHTNEVASNPEIKRLWVRNLSQLSGDMKGWCRLPTQLQHCFVFGVQKFNWDRRSEVYTSWQGNRFGVQAGKGSKCGLLSKLRNIWFIQRSSMFVGSSPELTASSKTRVSIASLQWQPLEEVVQS